MTTLSRDPGLGRVNILGPVSGPKKGKRSQIHSLHTGSCDHSDHKMSQGSAVGVGVAHLSVLWTTSAALSLLSLFLLLSRVQSRVIDSPAFVSVIYDISIMSISPDMMNRTVTNPAMEVNIMEEKQ